MQETIETVIDEKAVTEKMKEGKLNSGQIKNVSRLATGLARLRKDREETKKARVHGLEDETRDADIRVWTDGRFVERRNVERLYRDSFLGIDAIRF